MAPAMYLVASVTKWQSRQYTAQTAQPSAFRKSTRERKQETWLYSSIWPGGSVTFWSRFWYVFGTSFVAFRCVFSGECLMVCVCGGGGARRGRSQTALLNYFG